MTQSSKGSSARKRKLACKLPNKKEVLLRIIACLEHLCGGGNHRFAKNIFQRLLLVNDFFALRAPCFPSIFEISYIQVYNSSMTKNPLLNAVAALGYIIVVAFTMIRVTEQTVLPQKTIFIPIFVLSLLTLSASVMGYIFLSQPLQMYLDGKKKQAVQLFIQTVGSFAGVVAILLMILLSGVLK